jgi:hypothetical protein
VRRLNVDQTVSVSLDADEQAIPCRVVESEGGVSRLACRAELPPRTVGRLIAGSAGYLVFDEYGAPVGLRVAVRANPPYLDVAFIDGVKVSERREGERVRLVTRARIVPPDAGEDAPPTASTYTINVSRRGALLRDHAELSRHDRFTLELMFGDDPRPVTVRAQVARRVPDAVGVAFEPRTASDGTRLDEYLTGAMHRRGARD